MNSLYGLKVYVQAAWVTRPISGWLHFTQPPVPPRGRRKGTRKQWKRAHPRGLRWRTWQVEVDDHPILRTPNALIMTERTQRRLDARLAEPPMGVTPASGKPDSDGAADQIPPLPTPSETPRKDGEA